MALRHQQGNQSRRSECDPTKLAIRQATKAFKYDLNCIGVHLETVSVLYTKEPSQLRQDVSLIHYVDKIRAPLQEKGKSLSRLDQDPPPRLERSAAAQVMVEEYKKTIEQMGYQVCLCDFKERKSGNDPPIPETKDTSLFVYPNNGGEIHSASEPAVIIKGYYDSGFDPDDELLRNYWTRQSVSDSGRICCNCCVMETRQWVRLHSTIQWLCHSCGQFWRKNRKHRPEHLWNRPHFTRRSKRAMMTQRNQDLGQWSPGPANQRQAHATSHFSPTLQNVPAPSMAPIQNPRDPHGDMFRVVEQGGPLPPVRTLLESPPGPFYLPDLHAPREAQHSSNIEHHPRLELTEETRGGMSSTERFPDSRSGSSGIRRASPEKPNFP